MEQLIGGHWTASQSGREDVTSPFDGAVRVWRNIPGHERMRILLQAATLAQANGTAYGLAVVEVLEGRTPAAVANPQWEHAASAGGSR
jgi:acyl-CoA reductase-like NAD-dependent aldehyde dehydrogenase